MPDHSHKQPFSGDDEIEIFDLPTSSKGSPDKASRNISLGSRYSAKQRRQQVAISGSIVLALLIILIGVLPSRDFILTRLFPPINTTKAGGGDNLFYLQTIPAWGKWYLDGKQLKYAPVFSDEQPLRIASGKHVISWRAEPFHDLSCTLIVPPDPDWQTCRTRRLGGNAFASASNVINLPVPPSIAQLPPEQRLALIQATRNYLATFQSSDTVQPGEMYRYNLEMAPQIAKQTMQARLHFQLDTDISAPALCTGPQLGPACTNAANGNEDCRLFCTLAWSERDTPDRLFSWDVGAVTRTDWEYIPAGQQTDTEAGRKENQGDQQFTTLHITWTKNQWHVTSHPQGDSPFDDPNCNAAVGQIPTMLPTDQGITNATKQPVAGDERQQLIRTFASGTNRAMGCVATATIDKTANVTNTTTLEQPTTIAYFLWRFNVLLAVNDEAHQLWKQLPTSGTLGKNIVQKITDNVAFES